MDCGPGTVFNPAVSVCDWPNNVRGCEGNEMIHEIIKNGRYFNSRILNLEILNVINRNAIFDIITESAHVSFQIIHRKTV